MDFRGGGSSSGGGGGGGKKRGSSNQKSGRYNVTPSPGPDVNQLLLQQYFLQQESERGGGNSIAAAQAAAAAALFGGILNDKLMSEQRGNSAAQAAREQQQISELFAAAAAQQQAQAQAQAPSTSNFSTPTSRNSNTRSPSPRISSPHTSRNSNTPQSAAATAAALQQLTAAAAAAAAIQNSSNKKDPVGAALAAQQQWMYLDYLNRFQQEAQAHQNKSNAQAQAQAQAQQAQQQQAQQRGQGRGASSRSSVTQQPQPRGRKPGNQSNQGRKSEPSPWGSRNSAADLSRLFDYTNATSSQSLLKSSVHISAKLPADTEIIVQKNNPRLPQLKQAPTGQNKRGPKPKNPVSSTITSEQAKFEQQLINLGNNNAITITPAGVDTKVSASVNSQAPITITPANITTTPPPAHSTPCRYGNDKRDVKADESATVQPAHKYVKELYTHVIPRKPQIGLIGPNRKNNKTKQPVQTPPVKSFVHRPWVIENSSDVSITPSTTSTPPPLNLNKEFKEKKAFLNIPKPAPEPIIISPPDYSVPITQGWKREMILKVFDLNEENLALACEVVYISPEGKVFNSLNEIKKACLPDPKNYTFNSKIQLGKFVLPAIENNTKRFEYEELVEYFNGRKKAEAIRKRELRMKHEHNSYVKLLEVFRKNKRKLKLNEKKKEHDVMPKSNEIEELIDDLDNRLPDLPIIEGKKLNDRTFANLLQIHEFLHTFGETLGFDSESLPSLSSLQKAFLHVEDNEEELVSVLSHLLVCAVEDPGLPNPTGAKHLTPFGQTLKQADVTFGSMSEILRIYLNGISDSEPEAEEYAEWLETAPFTAQSAFRKSTIVAFICDVLLQNKAVLKYLENCSELIHNCKKEKQQNEIRIRKLRMLVARKQVAASIEEDGVEKKLPQPGEEEPQSGAEDSTMENKTEEEKIQAKEIAAAVADTMSSDPDTKLTIEELNVKMASLGTVNEKLKKQMQNNNKSIRSSCLGQDRWRRRYWNLHYSGGVYVEGGGTGEFEQLRDVVKDKLDKTVEVEEPPVLVEVKVEPVEEKPTPMVEGEIKEEVKEVVVKEEKRSTPFTVPPPVIKIFSFKQRAPCSGRYAHDREENIKATDDELLVKHVKKSVWYDWKCLSNENEVSSFVAKLCEKGIREKYLKNQLVSSNFNPIPELSAEEINGLVNNPEDVGFVDPELLYKIHLGLIETLETLEERVASASLQIKGWVLPQRNLIQENLSEEQIIEIVKERVLELEGAVERRYLKPPLGKSGLEVNLTQLLKESEDVSYGMLLDGPIGSTSSTRGQQINENNKLKMELKERERIEKELAARKEKEEGGGGKGESRFLNHWRDAIQRTTSPSVLSMAIYILDSSIAWDKSVMKASCQLCKGGDNEDKLLLCDACDRGYHTYCFKPPLDNIPDGDWFCWECINKATGNKCCIVCGKGQIPNIKLLCCDKCVKAYHQDCIIPPVVKAPRGRWFCPDHRENSEGRGKVTLTQAVNVSMNTSGNGSEVTTPVKKCSPKKKRVSERVDGNVSDSSNSSSFVSNVVSQESSDGGEKVVVEKLVVRPTTPVPAKPPVVKKKTSTKIQVEKDKEESATSELESGSETKPSTPNDKPPKISKKQKHEMGWCENILDDLVGHEEAWPFLEPVNTRQFPTYKKIIKMPMDLQTIRTRLVSNMYKNKEAFLQDVRLIFDNCETFNEDDSPVGKAGHALRVFFESKPGVGAAGNSSSGGSGGGGSGSGK